MSTTRRPHPDPFDGRRRPNYGRGQPKLQSDVAWALAQAVEDRLEEHERNRMYISLGAGESLNTIAEVLRIAADGHIPLDRNLVADVKNWHRGYCGTKEEKGLGGLIAKLNAPCETTSSAQPATERLNTDGRHHAEHLAGGSGSSPRNAAPGLIPENFHNRPIRQK